MLGGGGGMGMQGAMTPYSGAYAGGGAGGYSCYGSVGRSPGRLSLGRLGARSPGLRGGGSFEYESHHSGQGNNDGDYFNSTAWKRLPKNVAHWTTADVVSWLVMVDEICFIEAFVRRQISNPNPNRNRNPSPNPNPNRNPNPNHNRNPNPNHNRNPNPNPNRNPNRNPNPNPDP